MNTEPDGSNSPVTVPVRARTAWHLPSANPALPSETVHVWRAVLDVSESAVEHFYATLSADERDRAQRFSIGVARNRFIVSRAILRRILSFYLRRPPNELRFTYGPFGKPALAPVAGHESKPIHFNVSHTRDLTLVVIANREVGVDIELVDRRRVRDPLQIAERYFSARECAVLRQLPTDQLWITFLTIWTHMEALAKAVGKGLSFPYDHIPIASLTAAYPVDLVNSEWRQMGRRQWTVMGLDPGPGYVGALAVEGPPVHLERWQWAATPTG